MAPKPPIVEFLLVASGKFVSLFSLFICGVIAARSAGPIEFGLYSAALTIVLLFDAIVGAPLDHATVRFSNLHKGEADRIENVQHMVFRGKMFIGALLAASVYFYSNPIKSLLFSEAPDTSLLYIIVMSGVALLLVRSSSSYLQIHYRFKTYAHLDALQGVLRILLASVLMMLHVTSGAVFLAVYGVSAFLAFVFYAFKVPQPFIRPRTSDKKDRAKLLRYVSITSAIIILGSITGRVDIPILASLSTARDAGIYSAAMQLAFIGTLFASYVAVVFQPRVVTLFREEKLGRYILWNIVLVIGIGIILVPVAIYLIPWLLPVVFGQAYAASAAILQILLIGMVVDLVIMPILLPFSIQMLPRWIVVGEILITILFLTLVYKSTTVNSVTMAWIVSGIRIVKLAFYLSAVLIFIRLHNPDYGQELENV